ncbi:ribosomal protein S17A [Ranunculus cassubicifolius]
MGHVCTKIVKKSSRQVIQRYYSGMTLDFHINIKILEEVAIIPFKRLHDKVTGFSTHLMKRIQCGPALRERRMDFIADKSAINVSDDEIDKETMAMLAALRMADLSGVIISKQQKVAPTAPAYGGGGASGEDTKRLRR